jgi:hypothetical protein
VLLDAAGRLERRLTVQFGYNRDGFAIRARSSRFTGDVPCLGCDVDGDGDDEVLYFDTDRRERAATRVRPSGSGRRPTHRELTESWR